VTPVPSKPVTTILKGSHGVLTEVTTFLAFDRGMPLAV
jgi:hypothetical protein